jgi:hypothetical protein
MDEGRDFYVGFLGLHIGMDMDWIITFAYRDSIRPLKSR